MKWKILLGIIFVLPVMMLLPHLSQFPFQPGATYSDLLISHYPNGVYIQHTIQEWKTIPLWSDAILSGYPFAANPLSGLFYPLGWIALIFSLPLGFNIDVVLHLLLGGIGLYCFLRGEGLSIPPALLGAIIFEGLPKLFSHLGAGHITLIYAVTWTPWLLFVQRKANKTRLVWVLEGLVLGIIALADVRWAAYAGMLWVAYSIKMFVAGEWYKGLFHWLASRLSNVLFAICIAAPLLLPLIEYTRLSTRSLLSVQDNLLLSLPPAQLLGLVYPNIGGMAEWILYPGAEAIGLFVVILCNAELRRKYGFWLGLIGLSVIFALGSYIPPLALLGKLPGMDLLRVPPRILFLTGFGFAAVAGFGLQALLDNYLFQNRTRSLRGNIVLFSITAFVDILAVGVFFVVNRPATRLQFGWGAAFLLLATIMTLLGLKKRITPNVLAAGLLLTCLVDLGGVNSLSLEFRPAVQVLAEKSDLVNYLEQKSGRMLFRVYSPSYSLPQHIAATANINLADGVDPLQLSSYVHYMDKATGVPEQGYSVTLPPYRNANPAADNQAYRPDAVLLGRLNIKYLVSEFPINDPFFSPMAAFGGTHVYENLKWLPRAWVQSPEATPGQGILSSPLMELEPNRVKTMAAGPGELVLSEVAYPGWMASVDGNPVPIDILDGVFRGVHLAAGTHNVLFSFRPVPVLIGLTLAGFAWLIFMVLVLCRRTAYA